MDSISAINIVRDTLRLYLTDPYVTAGGTTRESSSWIRGDEPDTGFKYPKIEILKLDNPTTPIDIGPEYMEHEQLMLNIWFYSKNGFKLTVSGTEYTNAQVVEYYLGQIKQCLKGKFNYMYNLGVGGYKHYKTTKVEYDPESQLYFGSVSIRVWYFNT